MMVHPKYQRQGLGSFLTRRLCDEIDRQNMSAYVLASPAGVPLYTKFGFNVVGEVTTPKGSITSMSRLPRDIRVYP